MLEALQLVQMSVAVQLPQPEPHILQVPASLYLSESAQTVHWEARAPVHSAQSE